MSERNCLIGWQNGVLLGELIASAEEPSMPVVNLRDPLGSPSTAWQTPSGSTSAWVVSQPYSAANFPWRVVMMQGTNLTVATQIRVRIGDPATLVSTPAYDSTVLTPGVVRGQWVHVLPATVDALACRVDVWDTTNPDGALNVPLLYAGPAWQMRTNISPASSQAMRDGSQRVQARGGQEWIEPGFVQRIWNLDLATFRASDGEQRLLDIERAARRGENICIVPRPLNNPQRDALIGLASDFSPLGFQGPSGGLRTFRFTVTERL